MSIDDLPKQPIPVARLRSRAPNPFDLAPDAAACAAIAADLDIRGLRKLRFAGEILADDNRDWLLEGQLGATVVQDCVVTLAPVTTRLDLPVTRRFMQEPPEAVPDEEGEAEMPEDDTIEPLGNVIDPAAVMIEALALNLPLHPRSEGADLGDAVYAAPGVTPMQDEDARPFAGLAGLRDHLAGKDKPEEDEGEDGA
mgnify:FL=1|jgi:uncharacterized metal-binding protein YceD (DUF177 family)